MPGLPLLQLKRGGRFDRRTLADMLRRLGEGDRSGVGDGSETSQSMKPKRFKKPTAFGRYGISVGYNRVGRATEINR
jgi:hypothetical protein